MKKISYCRWLYFIFLLAFILLFSTTSLALIPGDFGSAGGGSPDGVVDFEDLMIFALAYGSTPSDPNWNPACDIASEGGILEPDGVIDFEDLMIFALHYGEEAQAIIPETTEIIDEETTGVLVSVSEDQSTIVLSTSTTQTDRIDPGDIIVMGITDQTPYGLLRRVTSISRGLTKESQVILNTEFATLEEAIQKGHWEYSQILKPEDIEKGFIFPEGIRPVRGRASTTLDHEYNINVILYDQDDNPATIEDNIMATGYLAFNYQIIFDGDIDGHTLKYFIFENIIETDSKLDISVGASVSIADLADVGDVTIGKPIPFTPVTVLIPTPIGIPIPLVFYPSIELKAGIEGEAHILLEAGIRQTASYTAGIEFTEGNWDNITTPPQIDYYEDPIEVNGGIYVNAHAGPQLNCKLYKVAGPYCKIFGYLDFEADTTLDPWWDLDAMLKVLAGVKLDIYTVHWGSGEIELINLSADIIDAGGPFGGTGPVHNLTKGTYYNTIQAALNDADNDNTIEVADGTYDESITFPPGKVIILQSVNGPSSTIVRGDDGLPTVIFDGSLAGTILEGFTITHTEGLTGEGIYICDSTNLIINNCNISDNTTMLTGGVGGGISIYDSTIAITGSTISNNTTIEGEVGGIYNNSSTLIITDSVISNNSGAGIVNVLYSALTITSSTISNNTSKYDGGGINNCNNSALTITSSTISNNTAEYDGGGIYNSYSLLTITNSTISGNSAGNRGGGIYLSGTENITIGGSSNTDTGNFNEFINNYKIGNAPSFDQHICDSNGDCHKDYPYNSYTPDNNGTYDLRDTGPAGGYIFYDKCSYSNGWRYLEAAPVSTEWNGKQWGSYGTWIGGTGTGIGTGQSNTTKIVTWLNGHSETDRAAQVCEALVYGGYSDWFLPSKDELNLMYTNLKVYGVGGFTNSFTCFYWSSSETNAADCAWVQSFCIYGESTDGIQAYADKNTEYRVRAVRAF
ncbi:hypothetical protein CVT91_06155 [Candidatus Atribacteria bacterium HGW-Atribacteria-1]|nr:MAG: hypothetical protein CVT91_06155 [Candidatus Atribacteria bacterium HGW-Atribacteria-1]